MTTALFEDWLKNGEAYRPVLIRLLTEAAVKPEPFCETKLEREYHMSYARACSLVEILLNSGLLDRGEFGYDTPNYGAANNQPLRYRFSASSAVLLELANELNHSLT